MGATKRNHGQQQGAQLHDEGEHGAKTKAFLNEQLKHGLNGGTEEQNPGLQGGRSAGRGTDVGSDRNIAHAVSHDAPGGDRLVGSYHPQHDEAEINSEKTRHARKEERTGDVPHDEWAERSVRASAKRKS